MALRIHWLCAKNESHSGRFLDGNPKDLDLHTFVNFGKAGTSHSLGFNVVLADVAYASSRATSTTSFTEHGHDGRRRSLPIRLNDYLTFLSFIFSQIHAALPQPTAAAFAIR